MATRKEIIATFDPSRVGLDNGNLYGLPFDYDSAPIIIFGVPWEATVSYHAGTADGPDAVLKASPQLDLYDFDNPDGWQQGIYYQPLGDWVRPLSDETRQLAAQVIAATEQLFVHRRFLAPIHPPKPCGQASPFLNAVRLYTPIHPPTAPSLAPPSAIAPETEYLCPVDCPPAPCRRSRATTAARW
jgi:hypothetical protein